jgi:DNA-binding response OmpR family regulator
LLAEVPPQASHPFVHAGLTESPLRLLIVDDDDDAHFFLRRDLIRCGVPVALDGVHDGDAALKYFQECIDGARALPDLVFLDVKMPGTNGFAVLEWVQSSALLGKMTIAMHSSSDQHRDVQHAMRLGASTYLTKPVSRDSLAALLQSVASRPRV